MCGNGMAERQATEAMEAISDLAVPGDVISAGGAVVMRGRRWGISTD